MDANLKAKWLADLRSGKFAQANGLLRASATNSYCCLGVLCISAGAEFKDWASEFRCSLSSVPVLNEQNIGQDEDQELSRDWMREIGLPYEEAVKLIKMNDEDTPFAVIADYIEKHL